MQNSPSIVIVAGMQKVVTHSGSFDPDDVLAVASLQLYLGVENVEIIRSRCMEVIEAADWVVDVGGFYDLSTNRFDHHQNGVPQRDNGVPYSALGLKAENGFNKLIFPLLIKSLINKYFCVICHAIMI